MNTNYIYVSNIPSNFKPVLLLHELENKWARMLYLENTFSGLRDAFIYNPTKAFNHFQRGIEKLRDKVINGQKPLTVFYVWFPPENVFISTMIPEGASMLSYIFVENLQKDVIPPEIIYDLPLQAMDVKSWDIPERQDKCMIIKLPVTSNNAMRSFVLGTLRSRMIRNIFPRASELLISEDCFLNSTMVPRSIKINYNHESYLSNFFYLHEIPSKLTVKMLIEVAKTENIKGCRVFFVETNNNMKYGFMYLPRSLPNTRFMALFEKLASMDFKLPNGESVKIKIQETWFRPPQASPPISTNNGEMILTDYLHLSGIPGNIQAAQLSLTYPCSLKLSVFPVNELSTQVGFLVVRGYNENEVSNVMNHFRNLELGGTSISVDEIYIHCHGLSGNMLERPFQLIPRQAHILTSKVCDGSKKRLINDSKPNNITVNITLTEVPTEEMNLMKTEFICVDNLPKNIAKAALIFDISKPSNGCVIIPQTESSKAFIYYPDCEFNEWKAILSKFVHKLYGGRKPNVYEVYLQTGELATYSGCEDSNTIFAYNLSHDVSVDEIFGIDRSSILYVELLETTNGSKSAFIVFNSTLKRDLTLLEKIRKTHIRGKPIYADIIKLASIGKEITNKRIKMFNE